MMKTFKIAFAAVALTVTLGACRPGPFTGRTTTRTGTAPATCTPYVPDPVIGSALYGEVRSDGSHYIEEVWANGWGTWHITAPAGSIVDSGYLPGSCVPMECDGDPADPLHCSAAGGETVCDTQPELCKP